MGSRAHKSGVVLDEVDAAIAKAMLARGDRQHDIAAWFGVNGGRIAEIATGYTFNWVEQYGGELPPPGPYPRGRDAVAALEALAVAERALQAAREAVLQHR
jgi:hypothetical protein